MKISPECSSGEICQNQTCGQTFFQWSCLQRGTHTETNAILIRHDAEWL